MCTLLLAWRVHPDLPLVVAANRDEFYARPAAPARFWPEAPELLAGRDLQAGGSWLGISRAGRFAAITNVREPGVPVPADAPSRGRLVAEFLRGETPPGAYLAGLAPVAHRYAGFNLVVGDRDELWYLHARDARPEQLPPGVHGVANARLATPWPKVVQGTARLAALVAAGEARRETLLSLLSDRTAAPDAELPDTGVGLAAERMLAPLFVASPAYGTCCSTVVVVTSDGAVEFIERTTNPRAPGGPGEVREAFVLAPPRACVRDRA